MKILVYPAHMEIGGSQMLAVDLARGVAEQGHDVVVFGPGGVLVPRLADAGLGYVRAPSEHRWPTRANAARLCELVRERRIDVVHGYEWGPCLDLALGPAARLGTPVVNTIMSMEVPSFLPRHAPLVVGVRELAEQARRRHTTVELIEPPIDLARNVPAVDRREARERFGVAPGDVAVAVVCRLTPDLGKIDGILEAVEVAGRLGADTPLRLLVIGDGPGLDVIARAAAEVNRRLGRQAVTAAGGMLDPRDAYDAADVLLGMGSSALRGMAFSKPLVVQGPRGFWRLLDDRSLPGFLQHGWYGTGDGDGRDELERILRGLLERPEHLSAFGALGRCIVEERYSLDAAVETQLAVYERAIAHPAGRAARRASLAETAVRVAAWKAVSKLDRSRPAAPVAAPEPTPA